VQEEANDGPKKELITSRDLKRTMIKKGELTVVQRRKRTAKIDPFY